MSAPPRRRSTPSRQRILKHVADLAGHALELAAQIDLLLERGKQRAEPRDSRQLFAPVTGLEERLTCLGAGGNRACQTLTDKNDERGEDHRDGEHSNASGESRLFDSMGKPAVQGMRNDGQRKRPTEGINEGSHELPTKHQQDPGRDEEHDHNHVIFL